MIALARLYAARLLLVLSGGCLRLAQRAAWPHPAREVLALSDACAGAARRLVTPIAHG